MIPADEAARCAVVAMLHGIDHRLLIALRETENGREDRAFGVLGFGAAADTWDEQADIAARTIRHTIGRYARAHPEFDWWDDAAGRYHEAFLLYFSRGGSGYDGYAPLRTANDPTGLNANHFPNLAHFYSALCKGA